VPEMTMAKGRLLSINRHFKLDAPVMTGPVAAARPTALTCSLIG